MVLLQRKDKALERVSLRKSKIGVFESERIRKRILRFFTIQINPRSLGSQCLKGTDESTLEMDSSVPLTCHDPKDLGLICLVKNRKIRFQLLSDLKIQSWIFLKKRTLSCCDWFSMKLHEMMFRIKTFFDSDNNFHYFFQAVTVTNSAIRLVLSAVRIFLSLTTVTVNACVSFFP